MGLGPQIPTEILTDLVDFLGHMLSRNHVSNFSDLDTGSRDPKCVFFFIYEYF